MNVVKFHKVCVDCKKNKQDVCFLFMVNEMYKTNDFCEDCYKNRLKNETIKAEAEKKTEKERKDAEKKTEKERKEAEKKTEKEQKDAKKKKVEEEKKERVENKKMEAEEEYTIKLEAKKIKLEAKKIKLEAKKIKLHINKPNKIIIPGFIYALSNGSIPNMIKIGFTKKNPTVRAKELSGTGLPTPYKVERFVEVHDKKKEKKVHKLLENMGHRVNTKREFFNVSMETINLIFNLIDECA